MRTIRSIETRNQRGNDSPLADDERIRVAYHEAGHAVAAHLLGLGVELVSIRPTKKWGGVCFTSPTSIDTSGMLSEVPLILQPAKLRGQVEKLIVYALAGQVSEELAGFYASGYIEPTGDEGAANDLATSVTLTETQREFLARGDDVAGRSATDVESACELAWALAGSDEAAAYLNYLRAGTRAFVYSREFRRRLGKLAPELLKREVLGARELRGLLGISV